MLLDAVRRIRGGPLRVMDAEKGTYAFAAQVPSAYVKELDAAVSGALRQIEKSEEEQRQQREAVAAAQLTNPFAWASICPTKLTSPFESRQCYLPLGHVGDHLDARGFWGVEMARYAAPKPARVPFVEVPATSARCQVMMVESFNPLTTRSCCLPAGHKGDHRDHAGSWNAATAQMAREDATRLWQELTELRDRSRRLVRRLHAAGLKPGSVQDAADALQNLLQNYRVP